METPRISFVIFTCAVLVTVVLIGAQAMLYSSSNVTPASTYTINGLACPIPSDYLSFAAVVHLLPLVTTNPQFLNLTNGLPYQFGNAENITDRTQQIDNQPVQHLPDVVEMVFYSTGRTTSCYYHGNNAQVIVVQVPIQGGGFNLTGASYHLSSSP